MLHHLPLSIYIILNQHLRDLIILINQAVWCPVAATRRQVDPTVSMLSSNKGYVAHGGSSDSSVSTYVRNPVYDAQGAYEDTRGPDITIPRPPTTGSCAPIAVSVAGRSWLDGRRSSSKTARPLRPTAGDTYEDVLPVASAGALSDVGSGGILGRSHRRDETTDGGYMDVEATLSEENDVSLITDTGLGRQESDVSLITDAGLGRQESDVSLITDVGIAPSRLSSMSEL